MVINIEGFIKYSAIHKGNYADTTAQNSYDRMIQIKRCSEPTDDLKQIQNALKQQKTQPFKQIKFVVHKPSPKKIETLDIAQLGYG